MPKVIDRARRVLTHRPGREGAAGRGERGAPAHLADQRAVAQNDTLRLLRFEGQLIGGEVTELDFAAMLE